MLNGLQICNPFNNSVLEMPFSLSAILLDTQYIPHGHCYLWQTPLVGLHVAADALIAIAYFSIPIILLYFVREIEELPFRNVFLLFGAFILSCGMTHLAEIWTLWHPDYWIYGSLKAITALVSIYTAATLVSVIPQVMKLYDTKNLAKLNRTIDEQNILQEIAKQEIHELNLKLADRVAEQSLALDRANEDLQESIKFRGKLADLTPNIMYIYDLAEKRNVYCNPYITELLGYTPQELKKFKDGLLGELIHPEDLPHVGEHFNQCLNLEGDRYLEAEYRIRDTDGQWHWLHDKNAIFSSHEDGTPQQILGIAQDITQTKKIQLQTKKLNQQLDGKNCRLRNSRFAPE